VQLFLDAWKKVGAKGFEYIALSRPVAICDKIAMARPTS
jgi:hypothetical protein